MLWTAVRMTRGAPKMSFGPLVRLPPSARVFPLGTANVQDDKNALLRFPEQGLTIGDGGEEAWAVVGDAEGRRLITETLLNRHRIAPSADHPGVLPVYNVAPPHSAPESWKAVRFLAFAKQSETGEFTDYTARYGSLEPEDRELTRDRMLSFFTGENEDLGKRNVDLAMVAMELMHVRDIPAIALSSGQTRRMRLGLGIMMRPQLLILEDPMAGLDKLSRVTVSEILSDINATQDNPRVMVVLRDMGEETLADWITNVIEVRDGNVWVGTRDEYDARQEKPDASDRGEELPDGNTSSSELPVVRLRGASVSYGEGSRQVLKNVNWTIRPGDRWHLRGSNGSGKTTLLSLILGHHPQSFSLPSSTLQLFSQPRRRVPTPILRQLIGHTSPEVFASFPRNMGLTALDAVGTGYEGVFSRRPLSDDQKKRVLYLLGQFKNELATSRTGHAEDLTIEDVARKQFAHYTPAQQTILVFLRAIVSRPPVLVLDEPTQGMDEKVWGKCRALLAKEWEEMKAEGKEQACIVVSHYDKEVPWRNGKVLELEDGEVTRSS